MSKLLTTMEAMQDMLAGVPEAPGAWVPLRRATVEEALRLLGAMHGVLAPMKALAAELEGERQEPVLLWQQGADLLVAATETMVHHGNGHMTPVPAEPDDNHVVIHPQAGAVWQRITGAFAVMDGRKQPRSDWSKLPKEERLAQVQRVIAELAQDGRLKMSEFDAGRPAGMSTAGAQVVAFGMAWNDLVKSALTPAEGDGAAADGGATFRA